ncbi:MAG: hypothetical protein OQK73_00690 [Gammaproteobacteria bacterium]|nr:hypothetical protein [Gammaproteobacteria bacterium]
METETWMKVGSAILLGMMILFILPRAKTMIKESPKASSDDWRGILLPLVLIVGFVILLIMAV